MALWPPSQVSSRTLVAFAPRRGKGSWTMSQIKCPLHTGVCGATIKCLFRANQDLKGEAGRGIHTVFTLILTSLASCPFAISPVETAFGGLGAEARGVGRGLKTSTTVQVLYSLWLQWEPKYQWEQQCDGAGGPREEGGGAGGCTAASQARPVEAAHPSHRVSFGMGTGCFPYYLPSPY